VALGGPLTTRRRFVCYVSSSQSDGFGLLATRGRNGSPGPPRATLRPLSLSLRGAVPYKPSVAFAMMLRWISFDPA
jgi:hypothetical protein